jgi:hypothetical protein
VSTTSLHVISRIAAALLGGYAFVWGFTTLTIVVGLAMGARYGDAQTTAYLLAFLVFLTAFLWAFASRSLTRSWMLLAGGGALMTGLASWLASGTA